MLWMDQGIKELSVYIALLFRDNRMTKKRAKLASWLGVINSNLTFPVKPYNTSASFPRDLG